MNSINRIRNLRQGVHSRSEQAFTLIEIAIAILIIGILAVIAIPQFIGQDTKVDTEKARTALQQAVLIVEKETIDNNGLYPRYKPNEMKLDDVMKNIEYRYATDRLSWCMTIASPEGTLYYSSTGSVKGSTLPPCTATTPNIGT